MDVADDNVVNDADQPQDDSVPKTDTALRNNLFKKPRPPTPNPKWNNDPLTLDELIATPIDFSKFAMNHLKIDKLTKVHLVGPIYNLLNGTYQSSIKLEYNMKECYKALSDQLDWNNPEGDCCPFDLRNPLPLKGHPGEMRGVDEPYESEYRKKPSTNSIVLISQNSKIWTTLCMQRVSCLGVSYLYKRLIMDVAE
ncbi:hypothetical protein Tco_0903455 [Tanacetum coccineum]